MLALPPAEPDWIPCDYGLEIEVGIAIGIGLLSSTPIPIPTPIPGNAVLALALAWESHARAMRVTSYPAAPNILLESAKRIDCIFQNVYIFSGYHNVAAT
jgi:hypothetical protein